MSLLITQDDAKFLDHAHNVRKTAANRPVFIRMSNGKGVTAKIVSVSAVSIGIVFQAPGQIGAILNVRFLLPVCHRLFEVNAKTRIIHTHLKGDVYYSTLEFVDISNDDLSVVESFIEEKPVSID
ncbi:MAG: PilZ domain-containing protein [Gammaproteobacteria bacterium]|nr:PilZ domain-containing protein [Gammaproteobacteria bacterium]